MQAIITHKSDPTEKGDFEAYFNIVNDKGAVLYKDVKSYLNIANFQTKIEARCADILSFKEQQKNLSDVIQLAEELDVSID